MDSYFTDLSGVLQGLGTPRAVCHHLAWKSLLAGKSLHKRSATRYELNSLKFNAPRHRPRRLRFSLMGQAPIDVSDGRIVSNRSNRSNTQGRRKSPFPDTPPQPHLGAIPEERREWPGCAEKMPAKYTMPTSPRRPQISSYVPGHSSGVVS